MTKLACPCCHNLTLKERGSYDICPVCWWEDDGTSDLAHFGPNQTSLEDARANYKEYGACDGSMVRNIRKPTDGEIPK